MDRYSLGMFGGRYYVRRPDWRRAGQVVTARVGAAALLAGLGTALLEFFPGVLQ